MAMDELNVIRSSEKLYDELAEANLTAFLQLARARYKDITGKTADETISLEWLMLFLLGYNPVTEYVYENEVIRKRERFAESMISSANKLAAIKTAMSLWLRQTGQYLVLVEDAAVLEAYKTIGVKRVRWVTQKDEKTCPTCSPRNGRVYPITNVPPKPHRNCRCYLVPVEGSA